MIPYKKIKKFAQATLCGERVVFHHVPKCGGTSIEHALKWRYALSYTSFPLPAIYNAISALHPDYNAADLDDETSRFREIYLLSSLYQDVFCAAGHVYFSAKAHEIFSDRYHFITTIRDPIAFFRSFFIQMATAEEPRWRVEQSFDDFLESDLAALFGKFYLLYFSNWSRKIDGNLDFFIDQAKSNLSKFSVVGILENLPSFEERLNSRLGTKMRIGHVNQSKRKMIKTDIDLTPKRREKIEKLSLANIAIYDFVKRELAG